MSCKKREACDAPCEWMEKQLNKVTKSRGYLEIPFDPYVSEDILTELPDLNELSSNFREGKVKFEFLSALQNKLLSGYYFEGLSYKKLAERHKISIRKVESQLYEAKKKLKRLNKL